MNCIGRGRINCIGEDSYMDISVEDDQCVLIQLTHNTDHYITFPDIALLFRNFVNMDVCNVRHLPISNTDERVKTFEYMVTGFLTG